MKWEIGWIVNSKWRQLWISIYGDYFARQNPSEREMDEVLQSLAPRMTDEAIQFIFQPFTEEDIKDDISSMSPLKSPSPDGYPAIFYHKYWIILGSNVVSCMLNFLSPVTGKLMNALLE